MVRLDHPFLSVAFLAAYVLAVSFGLSFSLEGDAYGCEQPNCVSGQGTVGRASNSVTEPGTRPTNYGDRLPVVASPKDHNKAIDCASLTARVRVALLCEQNLRRTLLCDVARHQRSGVQLG